MKPSNYTGFPMGSVLQKSETEQIAKNIMVILKRTGNEWRLLEWGEYKTERMKDGADDGWRLNKEKPFFNDVINYTTSPEKAEMFLKGWGKKIA